LTRVIWSSSSIDDLLSIRGYIDQFNPKAARGVAARLVEAGNSLKDFSQRGRPVGDNLRSGLSFIRTSSGMKLSVMTFMSSAFGTVTAFLHPEPDA
jgi:plasmid stabilization system protein ParE